MRSLASVLCLSCLVTSALASEPVNWVFQASATAGAAVVASRGNDELVRLGCRQGDGAAELFVAPSDPHSAPVLVLRLNELFVPLASSDGASATALLAGHVPELRRLQELELLLGPDEVVELPVPAAAHVFAQLADACEVLAGFEDHQQKWFLTRDQAGVQLGFGAVDSEFVGPAFRCSDAASTIEVEMPAPAGTPSRIQLRSGEVHVDVPATREPSVLHGGDYLRGAVSASHPFWEAFATAKTVEATDWTGEPETFGTIRSGGAVEEFVRVCARQ